MRDDSLKIVFFGTPQFASKHLEALLRCGYSVVAVVTQPDRAKGRSKRLIHSPVKQVAIEAGIEVLQPERASDPEFVEKLASYQADLFIVVAYGEILRQKVLDLPRLGCVNVHGSLLPKYRGAAPIQRCLMDGEQESGCSIMYMVRKMDAGDVIVKEGFPIDAQMSCGELKERLCEQGQRLLCQTVARFAAGERVEANEQDEGLVSFAPKIVPEDGLIDWERSAQQIHDQVRALSPRPGAYCRAEFKGKGVRLKILKSRVLGSEQGLSVSCGSGFLEVLELQVEGKRAMTTEEFIRGCPLTALKIL